MISIRINRPALLTAGLLAVTTWSATSSLPAVAAQTRTAVAQPATAASSTVPFNLRDGCGGANGDVHIGSNYSDDAYGIVWENGSGCGGKQQYVLFQWFDSSDRLGGGEIGSASPGQSNGFHSPSNSPPGTISGYVTLCSRGTGVPGGHQCWDSKYF
jgi:hypothetical protein